MVIKKSPGDAKWQPRYVHKSMKEMPMAAKIWVKGRKPEKITEGQQQQRSNNTRGLSDRPLIDHYCPDSDPAKTVEEQDSDSPVPTLASKHERKMLIARQHWRLGQSLPIQCMQRKNTPKVAQARCPTKRDRTKIS